LFRRYINDKLQSIQPREVDMGLHHTAHYLRSKGRGNDTMLVHMTPSEVKGLQAIALRHGGSLTINPDTGLPEAGFLEQILPVVAAAGLTYLTAGAAAPTLATALGSQMAGGIAAGALSGAAISGGMAAIQGKDVGQAALMGGLGGGISGGLGAYADANVFNAPNLLADASQKAVTEAGTQAVTQGGTQAVTQGGVDAAGNMVAMPSPTGTGFISPETGAQLNTGFGVTQQGSDIAKMAAGPEQRALLESLEASQGVFPEGSAALPGSEVTGQASLAPGFKQPNIPSPSMQSLVDQEAQARGGAARTIGLQPDTFYKGLGSYGKAGVQALPVLGLLEDEKQNLPGDEYKSPLRRISPDFQAYEAPRPDPYYRARYAAEGGIMQSYQAGGPVERMSQMNTAMNPQGGLYPMGMIDKTQYATPTQRPVSAELVTDAPAYERSNPMLMNAGGPARLPKGDPGLYRDADPTTRGQDSFTAALTRLNSRQKKANIKGLPALKAAMQPLGNIEEAAKGGVMSSLGGYSDGGRMLKGPGDGMSDSIPASIANKQPARLADGEFVVPADVVSHLGNGSTDAGARKLYAMMDKIRKARTGKKKQAPAVKADRYMPA
jgi:hypothetical protein